MVSTISRASFHVKTISIFLFSFFFDAVPLVTIFLIPTHLSFRRTHLGQVEEKKILQTVFNPQKRLRKENGGKSSYHPKKTPWRKSKQRKIWFKAGCCHITSKDQKKKKLTASFQTQDGVLHYQCLHLPWSSNIEYQVPKIFVHQVLRGKNLDKKWNLTSKNCIPFMDHIYKIMDFHPLCRWKDCVWKKSTLIGKELHFVLR